jgi:N utilization substance protein A
MAEIKFNDQSLRYITLFENITRASVKDCIEQSDKLYFIVNPGFLSKAIGKNGSNVKKLRRLFNKNIEIIEYSPKIEAFIQNIFHDYKINEIKLEERGSGDRKQQIAFVSVDVRQKGKIIGRDSKNLNLAKEILNRYIPIDIIIV